jgi:hypothetical protein
MPDYYSPGRHLMNPPATNGVTSNGSRPAVEPPVLGTAEHTDYYMLDELLTDEQRALRARVSACTETVQALIVGRDITGHNAFVPTAPAGKA